MTETASAALAGFVGRHEGFVSTTYCNAWLRGVVIIMETAR